MAGAIEGGDYRYAMFGGGLLGFEIGAGLAARLGAGVVMEVTSVRAENGELIAERPILGDSAISEVKYRSEVGIIIGRLNAFEIKETGDQDASVEELSFELSENAAQATMLTRGEQRGADVDIEGADILVAGGRGLGKAEGFQLAEDLAAAFGGSAAVAATRAVVDAGWYPYAAQIGQTGKTVSPKLYLAAGISGAIQHKVGMQSSENIIAINKDANAPIFEFSELGVVGDLNKIMPTGPLQELVPDLSREQWREKSVALGEVTKEAGYVLTSAKTKLRVPIPMVPNFKNHGNEVVSVSALARYQQQQAEEGGAYIL